LKEALAPTTVMTGNVTQLIIDLTQYLRFNKQSRHELALRVINGMYVVIPF
jgi:uncharacterized membrane protein YoaK (UPF0700 family)